MCVRERERNCERRAYVGKSLRAREREIDRAVERKV